MLLEIIFHVIGDLLIEAVSFLFELVWKGIVRVYEFIYTKVLKRL
jgi:hypothetical protein